jgi:hypothetical protein
MLTIKHWTRYRHSGVRGKHMQHITLELSGMLSIESEYWDLPLQQDFGKRKVVRRDTHEAIRLDHNIVRFSVYLLASAENGRFNVMRHLINAIGFGFLS